MLASLPNAPSCALLSRSRSISSCDTNHQCSLSRSPSAFSVSPSVRGASRTDGTAITMFSFPRVLALLGFFFQTTLAFAKVALGVGFLIAVASTMAILSTLSLAASNVRACLRVLPPKTAFIGEQLRRVWRRLRTLLPRRELDQPAPLAETIAPASSEPISTASEKRPRSLAPPPPHSLSRQLAESCSRHSGYAPLRMRHPLRINREQSRLRSAWLAGEPEPQIFRRPPPFQPHR